MGTTRIHLLGAVTAPIAVVALCTVTSANAELVSLQATRDATLYQSSDGSLANGAGRYLFAGKTNQNLARRSLLHVVVTE